MKIRLIFAWYDLWIGAFWDTKKRMLYIFPVPMIGLVLTFGGKIKLPKPASPTLLGINHFLFSWYYSRVDEHYRQWTFFKSVKLLIENYQHQRSWWDSDKKHLSDAITEADKLRKQVQAYQWKEAGYDPTTTMRLNNMFGTDMPTGNEN